jgi:predicted transcriptional regulator YdeE
MRKANVSTHRPSMIIVGISCRTLNDPKAAPIDIPKLWQRFHSENIASQIQNRASDEMIALYCDYEGDHTKPYTVVVGCPVTSVESMPEGMVVKIIPEGTYSKFLAIGEYPKALVDTWGEIWKTPLARTYTGDYEVYGESFAREKKKEVQVYVAVEGTNS